MPDEEMMDDEEYEFDYTDEDNDEDNVNEDNVKSTTPGTLYRHGQLRHAKHSRKSARMQQGDAR